MEANRNGKCSCGLHTSKAAHDTAVEAHLTATLETAIVRAVLPDAASRRAFLAAVGMGTTLAAISEIFSIAKGRSIILCECPTYGNKRVRQPRRSEPSFSFSNRFQNACH